MAGHGTVSSDGSSLESSVAESLSEDLGGASSQSGSDDAVVTESSQDEDEYSEDDAHAYSDDFAKTSASTVASAVGSAPASLNSYEENADDFEDDFEELSEGDRGQSEGGTCRGDGLSGGEEGNEQYASVAYSAEFEEDESLSQAKTPHAGPQSLDVFALRADLVLAQRELARIRGRDIQLLMHKQERAQQRREAHESTLARALADAEQFRRQVEVFRTQASEAVNRQIRAENEAKVQRTTIERLEVEGEVLRGKLVSESARAKSLAQERLREDCEHEESIRRETLKHEGELQKARQALAEYRVQVEQERKAFELAALERARAHEGRVDRMQATLEAEMVILQRERETLGKAQDEVRSKLELQLQEERIALEAARAAFARERDSGMRDLVKSRTEIEERRRALHDRELAVQADHDRAAKERHELGLLRSCVETERDKLVAARQEADLLREASQRRLQDAEKRAESLVARERDLRSARANLDQERRELATARQDLDDAHCQLRRERAKLEALAKTLASSLQSDLLDEAPPDTRGHASRDADVEVSHLLSFGSAMTPFRPRDRPKLRGSQNQDDERRRTARSTYGAEEPQDGGSPAVNLWNSELVTELLAFSPRPNRQAWA